MLITLKNAECESVMKGLLDYFIYTFEAPKNILTEQGINFVSQLVQNFGNLFRIKHIETTACHPQNSGSIERMYSTRKDLIKTSSWNILAASQIKFSSLIIPLKTTG